MFGFVYMRIQSKVNFYFANHIFGSNNIYTAQLLKKNCLLMFGPSLSLLLELGKYCGNTLFGYVLFVHVWSYVLPRNYILPSTRKSLLGYVWYYLLFVWEPGSQPVITMMAANIVCLCLGHVFGS